MADPLHTRAYVCIHIHKTGCVYVHTYVTYELKNGSAVYDDIFSDSGYTVVVETVRSELRSAVPILCQNAILLVKLGVRNGHFWHQSIQGLNWVSLSLSYKRTITMMLNESYKRK